MTDLIQEENLVSPLTQISDINSQLIKFKDDILSILSQSENRMNDKITNYQIEFESSKSNYQSSIEAFTTKYDEISQSIAAVNVKFDRLTAYEAFSRKANDQITTQEIRLNNISKDLSKACYKYDKIYMDNLILPGYIGDCCKFKNTKDFFNDVITQLSQFNSFKEKQSMDLRAYKDRMEVVIQNFTSQVNAFSKSSTKYTNESIKETEHTMNEMIKDVNSQITELSLENSRYVVEIKRQSRELSEEWTKILSIKNDIYAKLASEVDEMKRSNQYSLNFFDNFKSEFSNIKAKFCDLAEFIKDVRFRKNLKVDIKKKDITTLVKKLNFKRTNSLDNLNDKNLDSLKENNGVKTSNKGFKHSQSHEVESRLKRYINGETDVEHISQYHNIHRFQNEEEDDNEKDLINISIKSNDKIIHELGAELEQSNCKNIKETNDKCSDITNTRKCFSESPTPTQSYSGNNFNTTMQLNNVSVNGDKQGISQRNYSLSSTQPFLNPFDMKKEQKELDKKVTYTEKKVVDLESYTKRKIKQLSEQVSLLLSCNGINENGINVNLNGIIQSVSVSQNNRRQSTSLSKNKIQKIEFHKEMHKDQDTGLSFSNKIIPVSVIDLVKRNHFPIPNIQNMSSTLGNTSLVVNPKLKSKLQAGGEQANKILMQTFGANFEDFHNNSIRDGQANTPNNRDLLNRGYSTTSSLNNLADFRIVKKVDKKQIIDCDSKVTPVRWVPLQKVLSHTPHNNSDLNV